MTADPTAKLEDLKRRQKSLDSQRIQAETEQKHFDGELAKLKKRMKEEYGVDDVEALRNLYTSIREENTAALDKASQELSVIEERLKGAAAETA